MEALVKLLIAAITIAGVAISAAWITLLPAIGVFWLFGWLK